MRLAKKNQITPFAFFYLPTGSATCLHKIYVLPFNFFFFFLLLLGKYIITRSLFFSKGYNTRTLLCVDTASHISGPFFFFVFVFCGNIPFSPTCEIANREHNLRESVMHQFTRAIKLWMWWFKSEVHLLMRWLTGWLPWSSNKYNPWAAPLTVCVCGVFSFPHHRLRDFLPKAVFSPWWCGKLSSVRLDKDELVPVLRALLMVAVAQDERGSPGRKIVLAKFCCMSHAAAIHRGAICNKWPHVEFILHQLQLTAVTRVIRCPQYVWLAIQLS